MKHGTFYTPLHLEFLDFIFDHINNDLLEYTVIDILKSIGVQIDYYGIAAVHRLRK